MSKQLTHDEARHLLIAHLVNLKDFWLRESRAPTAKEKMEGLLWSILVTLDGNSGGSPGFFLVPKRKGNDDAVPGYLLIPVGTEEDKQYHIDQGGDYYAIPPKSVEDYDIGGSLRYLLNEHLRGEVECPEGLSDPGAFLPPTPTEICKCPMIKGGGIDHQDSCPEN